MKVVALIAAVCSLWAPAPQAISLRRELTESDSSAESQGYGLYKYYLLRVDSARSSTNTSLSEMRLFGVSGAPITGLSADVITVDSEGRMVPDDSVDCTGGGRATVAVAVDGLYDENQSNSSAVQSAGDSTCSDFRRCNACWRLAAAGSNGSSRRTMLRISSAQGSRFAVMGYALVLPGISACPLKWQLFGAEDGQPESQWTAIDQEDWSSSPPSSVSGFCSRYPLTGFYSRTSYSNCRRKVIEGQRGIDLQPVAEYARTGDSCNEAAAPLAATARAQQIARAEAARAEAAWNASQLQNLSNASASNASNSSFVANASNASASNATNSSFVANASNASAANGSSANASLGGANSSGQNASGANTSASVD